MSNRIAWLATLLLALAWSAGSVLGADRTPNVVIIFTDDLGYADIGTSGVAGPGGRGYETPHLDRMAAEGVRLTNFHSAQAVCSASRAALLTGCYSNRVGIHGALGPGARHGLAAAETTIAELVKPKGYATAIFGKWHLGHHRAFLPLQHGFDEYFGLPYSNDMWPFHPTAGDSYPPLPLIEGSEVIEHNPDQRLLTTQYTERAVAFIEKNRSQPFFLYVPHSMPHVPLFVSEKFAGKTERGLFGDVIAEIDWSVGQILDALRRNGLDEHTLVIFSSDNGPWLSYGDHAGSAAPLREGKGTAWEGGVRVPFIARWPGTIPAGKECRAPAMTIDLLPTIARLVGTGLPERPIDGKDIWPLLSDPEHAESPQEAYYVYYHTNELHAVISGEWKLYLRHRYRTMDGRPGGTDGKPAPYRQKFGGTELYHLGRDVSETDDIAKKNPEVLARMLRLAEKARADLGDRLARREGPGRREPGRLPR